MFMIKKSWWFSCINASLIQAFQEAFVASWYMCLALWADRKFSQILFVLVISKFKGISFHFTSMVGIVELSSKPRFADACSATCLEKWLQTWIFWDGMSWFCSESGVWWNTKLIPSYYYFATCWHTTSQCIRLVRLSQTIMLTVLLILTKVKNIFTAGGRLGPVLVSMRNAIKA